MRCTLCAPGAPGLPGRPLAYGIGLVDAPIRRMATWPSLASLNLELIGIEIGSLFIDDKLFYGFRISFEV